ncbi:MAG: hypothetical protein ACFFD3_15575 [Candidatus Thorarchaeota archaeon]
MKKKINILVAALFIILFVGSDLRTISSYGETVSSPSVDVGNREIKRVLSSTPPPRTPVDLRELVIELLSVTPLSNQSDSDGDLLYDVVEAVIGTDPTQSDTDYDQLTDYNEIMLFGTDPKLPDSNDDGLFDYDEVSVTLDLDNDAIPNAWDFDNDNDGVNDASDLSPMAKSHTLPSIPISVHTDGEPTYITFQLVPADIEHLRFIYQTWDWEDDDHDGQMQDLDGSKDDISLIPYLRLEGNIFPDQVDMDEFGILGPDEVGGMWQSVSAISVPLSPVFEFENIVAFNGRILYASSTPADIYFQAKLEWRVIGETDVTASNMKIGDDYISYGQEMIAIANVSDEYNAAFVEWITLSETASISTIAIKIIDGPYLAVAPDSKTLVFNSTNLGVRETFRYYKNQKWLEDCNGNFTSVKSDGTWGLIPYAGAGSLLSVIDRIDTVYARSIPLVKYTEPFKLTGLTVQEFYGTDVGIFYNVTDKNQTIAGHWLMDYRFVNNATTTLEDMPTLLQDNDVAVSHLTSTVRDKYESLVELRENLVPVALDSAASGEVIPITIAIEDSSKIVDFSETLTATYILSGTCSVNLASADLVTSKSLKMNWYNSSTYTGLSQVEITSELLTWGLDGNATFNLQLALMRWHTGENKITKVNAVEQIMDTFDASELDTISYIGLVGLETFTLAGKFITIYKNWKYLKEIANPEFYDLMLHCLYKMTGGVMSKTSMTTYLFKNSKFLATLRFGDQLTDCVKSSKYAMSFKDFESALFVIGIIVEIGLGIAAGCMIADQIGGSAGREFGTAYGILAVIVGVWLAGVYALIGTIPFIGWLISLGCAIYDATTNFSQNMIVKWVQGLYGNICRLGQTIPNVFVENVPTITPYDFDHNGVDVGDFIVVNGTLWNEIDVVIKYLPTFWDMFDIENTFQFAILMLLMSSPDYFPANSEYLSWILPYVDIIAPEGSNSYTQQAPSTYWEYLWKMVQDYLLGGLETLDYRHEYFHNSQGHHYVYQREYAYNSWIMPGIAMADFPITTRITASYRLSNWWWHCPVWYFGAKCYHTDWFANYTQFSVNTQYYDIFPGTLNDFLSWKEIKLNDQDGDGLNETQEIALGTSPVDYDTDADGLDDKYEIDHGYNPTWYDTDSDKVTDWYELVYGTNVTDSDTDQDGLSDFEELSGWIISFNYLNNASLPFQIHVTSDPRTNDSDGDAIDDFIEFRCGTNPRSNDTNGDSVLDSSIQALVVSVANYETHTDINDMSWIWDESPPTAVRDIVDDIAIDDDGNLYISWGSPYGGYYHGLKKFYPNLTEIILPSTSYFTVGDSSEIDGITLEIAVDDVNDWLYIWTYRWDWVLNLVRYNLDGSELNATVYSEAITPIQTEPDLIPSYPIYRCNLDIDINGKIYISKYQYLRQGANGADPPFMVYDSSGTSLVNWSTFGITEATFDNPVAVTVDDVRGFAYIADNDDHGGTTRIIKRSLDGSYIDSFPATFDSIIDLDTDSYGYVYALCNMSDEYCVRRFDSNGLEDVAFTLYGNSTSNFYGPEALAISSADEIYVVDTIGGSAPGVSRIWKFTQDITLVSETVSDANSDWDNDGLTNVQEISGWDITVEFSHGSETFRVTSNYLMNDTDLDGLGDYLEFTLGSNPNIPDTDLDGITDHHEWWASMYPDVPYMPPTFSPIMQPPGQYSSSMSMALIGPSLTNWDTDGDLLRDGIEYTFGSSPVNPDMDGDGLSDLTEFLYNSNPNSTDTDLDGASDAEELAGNSSLLSPDSDSDLIFDGTEYDMGTNATDIDSDGDGIPDGYELIYVIDPMNADSDGDGVPDDIELSLYLDPRSNDTDKDGVPDGTELATGSNPWSVDSDYDGIPDGEDSDTLEPWDGTIILVLEPNPSNETLDFVSTLQGYSDVILASVDELLSDYSDEPYVVLVGQPDPNSYSVEGLMYDLLVDTGDILDRMMEEYSRSVATRLGVWTETQTVLMLASAFPEDALLILQLLKGRNATVLPDSIRLEYQMQYLETSGSIGYAIRLNEIDIVRKTGANITIYLSGSVQPRVTIMKYNITTTPHVLDLNTGLEQSEAALGIYLDITIQFYGATMNAFEGALIQLFYKESDLDLTGNGQLGDLGDINETSLSVYYFDENEERWIKLTEDLPWVLSIGQNTTNVEIYGENYAGYLWVQVTELRLFALAGQVLQAQLYDPWMTVIALLIAAVASVGAIITFRKYRSRGRDESYGRLLSELQG